MNTDIKFPDQNSTNFPIGIRNNMLEISKNEYNTKDYLKYHQFIVEKYLINNTSSRGLLLFHEMGMGKSITAAAIAEYYREHDSDRKIIILLPKSLQSNFEKNIEKFIDEKKGDINNINKYKFISLNASNMFTQIGRSDKNKEDIEIENQLKEFTDVVEKDDFLENSLLIIDEFHNFSNAVTNGSYNAMRLYDTIMKTKDIKLLFLSGTPIINAPFELVPTFNMLKGHILYDNTNMTLFPELQREFDSFFVDKPNHKIKNAEKFKNRIFGMCSYYGNMYFGKTTKDGFPQEYIIKVEKVHMSAEQYSSYSMARDFEIEESSKKGFKEKVDRFTSKSSVSKSYRVKSRQISNYLIPEYALGPPIGKKSRIKYIDKISDSDLLKLDVFSPKFKKILYNINKHKNQLGLLYSEFVSGEGIAIFAKLLDLSGYKCFNKNIKLKDDLDTFGISGGKPTATNSTKSYKYYALITGDISFDDRSNILKKFNDEKNKTGSKIALLLISKTGAEGLDLKNVRHVHLMEPYWNYARLSQIIARAVRFESHKDLGIKFRNVQPYIYLSDYPVDFNNTKKKRESTTDIDLYMESIKNKKIINDFYLALAEASIDCSVHSPSFQDSVKEKIKCKLCSPNNKQLYHPMLSKQMLLSDPCDELKSNDIKVHSLSIPGRSDKYFYSRINNNIQIYKYDDTIKGYIIMDPSDILYSDIMKKLLKI